ncbi:von Willebrand factor A domain-containing protein 2 isoform X1 [Scleropages formosus]|uniref:von Willebrand factor A domain-containing protein 2 isoform X1 n=2 Tax=Scleropages formosus TaxID=113540 RepID=UPI0010FA75E3|nr:von Willebrand factor A domain-containing protein 2 isoform X1 [Scleropages formosus]
MVRSIGSRIPKMHLPGQAALLSSLLLIQVRSCVSVQEIHASQEMIVKIDSAGESMRCSAPFDLLLLLDGSHSVGKGSFERCKHFAQKLVRALDVGPNKVRVGAVQFGSSPRLEFPLDSHLTEEELVRRLKKISYRGGSTQTGLALKYVLRKGFPGGRDGAAPRVLVLLSDGRSQGDPEPPALRLKRDGVAVFAVGVRYPRWEELHALASTPREQHVLFAEHFADAVNGLLSTLSASGVCAAAPPGCRAETFPCVQKTLETVKELQGNFMCWKGSKGYLPSASLCPYYRWNRVYKKHQTTCHRTVCSEPCDSTPCQNGGTCVSEGPETFRCLCPPGYGDNPTCDPQLTLECTVDLLFLVDGSSSLGLEGFLHFKSFLKRFLQVALGGDTPVNVGVAQYSSQVTMEAKVGEYRSVDELLRAVEATAYGRGGGGDPHTGAALQYVTRHGFTSRPVFADVQDDLPRVVVLLSGSPSADPVDEPARYARDREIFLVAVGPEALKAQLSNITGNLHRTVTYSAPGGLEAKIPELRTKICSVDNQGCPGQALDLVMVLDASAAVGRDNFARLRDFVRSVSVQFDINRDVAQIGLVAYGRMPVTAFDLDTHASGAAVLRAVGDVPYLGGASSTGSALLHVHSETLTVSRGARPGVNKAVVVVTDGAGAEDALVPAQKIRDNGVSIFVVGIGDVQRDSLLRIAGSVGRMVSVASYEDLQYFDEELVQMLCADAKRPVDLCRPNPCMNDGICILLRGSYHCECRGWEGPHCEYREFPAQRPPPAGARCSVLELHTRCWCAFAGSARPPTRGDLPRPASLRRSQWKSHKELRMQRRAARHRGHAHAAHADTHR